MFPECARPRALRCAKAQVMVKISAASRPFVAAAEDGRAPPDQWLPAKGWIYQNIVKTVNFMPKPGISITMDEASMTIGGPSMVIDGSSMTIDGASLVMDGTSLTIGGASLVIDGASMTIGGVSLVMEMASMVVEIPAFIKKWPDSRLDGYFVVGTIALRCPRWRFPLFSQRNGELSGGGRESAGHWWPSARSGAARQSLPMF